MSLSVAADVLDALYDGLIAYPSLASRIAADTLHVSDGPPITDWSGQTILVVGAGPTQDDESNTEATSNWSAMAVSGSLADVDEYLAVPCGIATLFGSAKQMRAARREAFDVYAAAYEYIRGTTLGIPRVMWCQAVMGSIGLRQTSDGAEILIRFTANVRTRI